MAIIYLHHKLEQIPDLIFNELRKGALKKKHPFKNVVLTTVSNVIPKARWVVFRKLTSEGKIYIYTDGRSDKVKELKNLIEKAKGDRENAEKDKRTRC